MRIRCDAEPAAQAFIAAVARESGKQVIEEQAPRGSHASIGAVEAWHNEIQGTIRAMLFELKENYSIAIVTHNMQQAARVSDQTAFFFEGRLIESGNTESIFTKPKNKQTEDYVTGRFG